MQLHGVLKCINFQIGAQVIRFLLVQQSGISNVHTIQVAWILALWLGGSNA